jgi:hypothetical protein
VRCTHAERARDDTVRSLRAQPAQARTQVREFQGQFDALATVTANLYAANLTLRQRLENRR